MRQLALRLVIPGFGHFDSEPDVFSQIVFVGDALEIIPELVALGEEVRPVVIGLEGVGIKMVRRIDAAAGIDVLVPGAADGVVLLQDDEGDAGLLQLNPGIKPGHAGADDDDLGIRARRGRAALRHFRLRECRLSAVRSSRIIAI